MTIEKRIPVAAGLGGGSADAAAVLRAANRLAGRPLDRRTACARSACGLGADVPSQIEPRHALVTGAGEGVEPVELPPMTLLLVPDEAGLSTAEVYAQADALGTTRAELDPDARARARGAGRSTSWPPRSRTTSRAPRSRCGPSSASAWTRCARRARSPPA